MLFSLCISSLTTQAIYQQGDKFYSSLVAFAAVLGIQPQGLSIYKPYHYTTKLAGIAWLRAWVQWVIQSTTTILKRDLLLGYQSPARVQALADTPTMQGYSFSFLKLPANQLK
ncbi:uncharacterized protein Aud_007773, partial [Aspergillus udagawae]